MARTTKTKRRELELEAFLDFLHPLLDDWLAKQLGVENEGVVYVRYKDWFNAKGSVISGLFDTILLFGAELEAENCRGRELVEALYESMLKHFPSCVESMKTEERSRNIKFN